MGHLTSRPYAGPADFERTIDLVRVCRAEERVDPWPPLYELRQHLRAGDAGAGCQLWEARSGHLAAFATIWEGATLLAAVHPQAECEDLDEQVLGWGLARARGMARQYGEQSALLVPALDDDRRAAELLERHGFRREDWAILRMARRLDEPFAEPALPPGFALRPVTSELELAAVEALHQEVFVAGATLARDRLAPERDAEDFRASDLVVVAPGGELAAFCLCSTGRECGSRHDARDGWIDLVGTRPAYRRRGLGRVALLAGLRQLQQYGALVALLGTTSWNTRAQMLFESAGFRLLHQVRWYAWEDGQRPAL